MRDIDLPGIMFTKNRIEISGNITGAAETREVGDATVTKARLVHNQIFRMPDGSTGERLVAIDLEIWGKRGEAFAKYVTTKVPVVVEGQLLMDQWQDKVGARRSRFLVRVQNWQFLSPKLLPEDDPILNESGGGEPAAVRQREPVEIGQTG